MSFVCNRETTQFIPQETFPDLDIIKQIYVICWDWFVEQQSD